MAENDNGRKKALIASVLVFLFFGGGIFLFFIIQGADDLKGDKTKNFSYGSEVRAGVGAFMKNLGFASDEPELSRAAQKRVAVRELASSSSGSEADISDWMAKGGTGAGSSGNNSAQGSRAFGASAPRMAARSSGLGSALGAGTKSSGETSGFGSEGGSGNVSISKAGAFGARGQGAKSGTLSALRNSQAFLGDALRSSSAMEAKNKWGQGFGVGNAGSPAGLAYGKSGLARLDAIKSGEIASLKTTDPRSLRPTEVSPPERDKAAEANDPALSKMKEAAKDAANLAGLANPMFGPMFNSPGARASETEDKNLTPPKEVTALAEAKASPCSAGCECGAGCTFKDNPPTYQKTGDGWQATISGQQTNPDGTVDQYKDVYNIKGNPPTIQ